MAFTPMSAVYLLDTPLDNTNKNQLLFSSVSAQWTYFQGRIKHTFEYVTYQRKDNTIRVNKHIDDLWNVNYVMYQNGNFSNKWFYAFINKMEYISDNVTEIYIETDVYQTWLFDVKLKPSFVVREHVRNDSIGANMVDEQLETGEYVSTKFIGRTNKLGANWNILAVSDNTPMGDTELIGNLYGNVITGMTYYPFPNTTQGVQWLKDTIALYDAAGKPDAIVMIFTVPELAIEMTVNNGAWVLGEPILSGTSYGWDEFVLTTKPTDIDGYVPKNKKLFTNPYVFLYVTNSIGQTANLHYEYFKNNDLKFYMFASPQPDLTVMLVPMEYRNSVINYEYGLSMQGYPLCSWTSDTYNAWFAQNSASSTIGLIGSIGAVAGGLATGNVAIAAGGALAVAAQLAQINKATIQPDQAKGQTGSGNLKFANGTLDYYFSPYSIRAEFAKRIDDFFSMYGYKVNTVKVPETHSRRNWNYIHTIDINIDGTIPTDDMSKLKRIYNNGVTLWHSASGFLNYGLNNDIIV